VEAALIVAGAIVFFVALALLLIYNRFVHLRNMIDESWHDIGTELQRRYDLIPNLVNTVKGYAAHEREVFESVTSLRLDAMAEPRPPDAQAPREQALGRGVAQLMAVAENYPDLKASDHFLSLQRALIDTEDRIQVSRRIYNANVRAYDTLVQSFPAVIIARRFRFELRPYFEVEPAVREAGPPSVDMSGHTGG
jgi:LemA protein